MVRTAALCKRTLRFCTIIRTADGLPRLAGWSMVMVMPSLEDGHYTAQFTIFVRRPDVFRSNLFLSRPLPFLPPDYDVDLELAQLAALKC